MASPQTLLTLKTEKEQIYEQISQIVKEKDIELAIFQSLVIVDAIEGNNGFIDKIKIKQVLNMHGVQVSSTQVNQLITGLSVDKKENYNYLDLMTEIIGED